MRFAPKRIDSNGTIPRTNAHTLTHMFQFVPEKRTEAVDDVLDATPAAYFRVQNTQSRHFHVCYVPGGEPILPPASGAVTMLTVCSRALLRGTGTTRSFVDDVAVGKD